MLLNVGKDSHYLFALSGDVPNTFGFSPLVNQRLLPPTFPRYTKIKDRLAAITYLEELTLNLKHASKIIHCTNYHSALVSLINAI